MTETVVMKKATAKTASDTSTGLTRRDFLKATSVVGASFAIATAIGSGQGLLRPVAAADMAAADQEQVFIQIGGRGESIWVYVKNGRVIRIRPARAPKEKIQKTWEIKVGNRIFEPTQRAGKPRVAHYTLTLGRRVYDPHRIKYPMKRVDWSPSDRRTQNRGKSKFVRISWNEALDTIASELKRANDTYGPSSILHMHNSHMHPGQNAYTAHDPIRTIMHRAFCFAFGGHTACGWSCDSWEGWVYGGAFCWGYSWSSGRAPKSNLEDVMQNSKLVVDWTFDPLGQETVANYSVYQPWLRELGIKRIFIAPELNWTATAYGDKWIPVLVNEDTALAAAIAYVWISEDTYDKSYVVTHGYGFEKWKDYVMGVEDGVPKTPAWAEKKCGVKARIIKALAKEWASKPTMIGCSYGGPIRAPYGHEWPRMLVLLMTMQGLGKPGRQWSTISEEPSNPSSTWKKPESGGNPEVWGNLAWAADKVPVNSVPQFVWKSSFPDAILKPPIEWYGMGLDCVRPFPAGVKPWFAHTAVSKPSQWAPTGEKYTYPMKGYSEVRVVSASTTAQFGCWTNGARWIEAYQSPKIEFYYRTDYWWGGDAIFSDILLPACTPLERNDILTGSRASYLQKCVDPLWDTKSDFWIEAELSKRLGVYDKVHEGLDEDGWLKRFFDKCTVSEFMKWEEFKNLKGTYTEGTLPSYFETPWNPKNVARPPSKPGFRAYAEAPEGKGLDTKSGKFEFYAQWIDEWFPGDKERPPVPHYITSWEGLESPLAKKYPLLVESPHPRFRHHTQFDENPWLSEVPGHKLRKDGYAYEALWMNPADAAKRGIKDGDLVRVFNDRGQILCAAYVKERIIPGVVRATDGGYYDPTEPGNPMSLDKGGCMNFLSPSRFQSKNASSFVVTGFLVQVEKYTKRPIPTSASEVRIAEGI